MKRVFKVVLDDSGSRYATEIMNKLEQQYGAEEVEQSDDCISRGSIRRKLQEHHDFFVNAYDSYEDMNFKEIARVDEIDNCIAMVVNEPPVYPERPKGKWIEVDPLGTGDRAYMCSECKTGDWSVTVHEYSYCPYCGAKMEEEDV